MEGRRGANLSDGVENPGEGDNYHAQGEYEIEGDIDIEISGGGQTNEAFYSGETVGPHK